MFDSGENHNQADSYPEKVNELLALFYRVKGE